MREPTSAFAEEHQDLKSEKRRDSPTVLENNLDDVEEKRIKRRLLLKLDLRILPILALLFLMSFLDRTNIGNASTLGLKRDLDLSDHQYSVALIVYYLFYIVSEVPSNLLMKKVSPRIWLPLLTALWGLVCMCLGFVRNYASLVVVRSFLGITEGGLLPGIVLFLSMMYKRREMGLRMGLIYGSASLSGAFGGLLAAGLNSIGPVSSTIDAGWRWIFIVEGLLTIVVAGLCYIFLPNSVEEASFLSAEERTLALARLRADRPINHTTSADGGKSNEVSPHAHESMDWSEVRRGFLSLQTWLSASGYFAVLCGLYSFGLFQPAIVQSLGYSATRAQLFTVPPYAVACILTFAVAYLSDRLWLRGPIILCCLPFAIAGYAMISTVESSTSKYGALFLMGSGQYCAVPAILVWLTGNSAGHYKRATVSALQLAIANCGGFVAASIYHSSEKPNYRRSHHIILGLLCYAWVAFALNTVYCAWKNKQKRAGKYDKYIGYGDDRDPLFKMTL